MATFPYNPTRILSSPRSEDVVYVFQHAAAPSMTSQLLAINASTTLNATSLPYSTISPTLPFLEGAQGANAYTPAIDDDGTILLYTGKCGGATAVASLWQFNSTNKVSSINGTWKELDLTTQDINGSGGLVGANYLASAITFSSMINGTSDVYIFGGMCPNSTSLTADNWTHSANYSNTMLIIGSSAHGHDLGISSSRGPPVAEAGFTITPLQPTFFDSASSNETKSSNQNFVLLGGHTQEAFINMSQIALFSLPEQSWTFLPVDSALAEPNSELTMRGSTTIDSRSGHTAILTSDGKSVVVFGGWVGDITQPADPQLAVLELGQGYGGSGDWQWSIPSQARPGLEVGTGIYGHGAVMLPGNVMMVVGGYRIPVSGHANKKRQNSSASSNVYFFNTTSNSWSTTYTHPKVAAGHRSSNGHDANNDAVAKRVGLIAGLTLGIVAILAILIFFLWYSRRLKRRRVAREDELRNLAAAASRHQLSGPVQRGNKQQQSEMISVDWLGGAGSSRTARGEPEAERTGLLFETPSPTRGLRRSLHSRGNYQPTSRYDGAPGLSTIHPIDERDEYDEDNVHGAPSGHHETIRQVDYNILSNVPVLDPFHDAVDGSRTPSPQSPQDRELEIRNWVNDWTRADALMHQNAGRLSPEKNDRTSSTLSDRSARSASSSHSIQHPTGDFSRSMSQRSAALFNHTPFRSTMDTTPVNYQQNSAQRYSPEHRRSRSLTLMPVQRHAVTPDTFATAETSFSAMQAEGEALLGQYPDSNEASPIRSQSRARGWMGSVRRAFAGGERSTSTSPENNASTSSSPIKSYHREGELPRRAASTGAMLWQKRQGAKDWDVEGGNMREESSNEHEMNDDDWDVESAVERRVVQVMFTVPKEKLRVVNQGPDGDGESVLSAEAKETTGEDGEHWDKRKGTERQ